MNERPYTPSQSKSPARTFDLPLLATMFAMLVFGLIMLYSASWDFSLGAYQSSVLMFERQLMWLAIGVVIAAGLAFFDYHHWNKLVVLAMLGVIVLLIAVLLINEIRFGAKRAFFSGSVQPSELAKLISIIYLSVWLCAKRQHLHNIQLGLIPWASFWESSVA